MTQVTIQQAFELAVAQHRAGRLGEAAATYDQILARQPAHAGAMHLRGAVAVQMGQVEAGVEFLRRGIALTPNYAEGYYNFGIALQQLGRLDEAIAAYRQAIALRPNFAQAYGNLGSALNHQGQLDEAVSAYRRSIALDPNSPETLSNLGNVLRHQGRLDESIATFRQALAIKPEFTEVFSNLIFAWNFHPAYDPAAVLAELSRWDAQYAAPLRNTLPRHDNDPSPDRRLKIGYFSPDFRDHCQSFFTLPLLRNHRHELFDIYLYSRVFRPDDITRQIRNHADTWRNVAGLSDQRIAEQIHEDRIDILVDLTMHMANCRPMLFARKPAPIQIAWLAYPGTTGLSAMDYRLTDPYLDPPGEHDQWYREKSIRLADTFWCYDPLTDQPQVNALPALSGGHVTFGCLNNFCKVTDRTLSLWSRVLKATPGSKLILLSPQGEHRQRVLRLLDVESERVEFVANQKRDQYLRVYHRIDICLDTFHYNGHTTSLDALWMGVPVISLCGDFAVSRAGFSQYTNLGLADEFVARTDEEFVSLAVKWAAQPSQLAEIRATLRPRMERSPLMDGPRFAAGIESVYRDVWQSWCRS